MIPLAIQAWIGAGIAACVVGLYELRADVRAIHVPKLPAKYLRRGQHHARRGEESTMQRVARAAQQSQVHVEPDWLDDLRATWHFGDTDEFDARAVGGAGTYDRLPWVLDGSTTREFRRLVGTSEWGSPVDVDEWQPATVGAA